ncbi:hypothetical protein LINPERPRIM_LOCUS12592 [Linum perenne]
MQWSATRSFGATWMSWISIFTSMFMTSNTAPRSCMTGSSTTMEFITSRGHFGIDDANLLYSVTMYHW